MVQRPKKTKKSPAPAFHAASKAVRRELWDAYALFVVAYRSAEYVFAESVVLSPIPCWARLPADLYSKRVKALVEESEEEAPR